MSKEWKKCESFELDHTKVVAPFIRVVKKWQFGDYELTKFDIRFCQPNEAKLLGAAMHSMEHKIAVASITEFEDRHIDFSPMGCKTGFYWLLETTNMTEEEVENKIRDVLKLALDVELVGDLEPTPVTCGSYKYHDPEKANEYIKLFLEGEKCI